MSQIFLLNASFHSFLIALDQELASKSQGSSCIYCGGKLHKTNYPRSPFGVPQSLREYYDKRFSFCCSECRKRTAPQSVRFFGRR